MIQQITANTNSSNCCDSGACSASLGNSTKSNSKEDKNTYKYAYDLMRTAGIYLKEHRVSTCQKTAAFGNDNYEFSQVPVGLNDTGNAKFGGLNYCGNVWTCPVCSRLIAAKRIKQVRHCMRECGESGGQCGFVSLTMPHTSEDKLDELLPMLREAKKYFSTCRRFRDLMAEYDYQGEIRAFEATHGDKNGWHPHFHSVYFFGSKKLLSDWDYFESELHAIWLIAVLKKTGRNINEHGLDVQWPSHDDDSKIAAYVGKWGAELALGHTKRGAFDNRTPWQILDDLHQRYSPLDQSLMLEWAACTKGMARIYIPPKLRELYDVASLEDKEIADENPSRTVFTLSWNEFNALRLSKQDGRLLDIVPYATEDSLRRFVNIVVACYDRQREKEIRDNYLDSVEKRNSRLEFIKQLQLNARNHLAKLNIESRIVS